MEAIVADQAPNRVIFHVNAELTRYRGRGFLMIRMATWERPADSQTVR
jgi:hypothetical protein